MKKIRRISYFFIVSAVAYLGGFYTKEIEQHFYPHKAEEQRMEELSYEATPAVTGQADTTTCDTEWVTLSVDLETNETLQEESAIPAKYIGMSREDLTEVLTSYELSPPLSELDKGLTSVELVSFSGERVVLKKTYYVQAREEGYVLVAERNYITVYYKDLQDIYLYTDIRLDILPVEIQQEIMAKKYIDSEEELYNFLESYSS